MRGRIAARRWRISAGRPLRGRAGRFRGGEYSPLAGSQSFRRPRQTDQRKPFATSAIFWRGCAAIQPWNSPRCEPAFEPPAHGESRFRIRHLISRHDRDEALDQLHDPAASDHLPRRKVDQRSVRGGRTQKNGKNCNCGKTAHNPSCTGSAGDVLWDGPLFVRQSDTKATYAPARCGRIMRRW